MGSDSDYLWKLNGVSSGTAENTRLDNISVSFKPGITAILGRSGAGKSTLINLLSKLELPTGGTIDRGSDISQPEFPFYIVPQDYGLWPHINVKDHLLKSMKEKDEAKADMILAKLDLTGKEKDYPGFISQGECSRLSIARALATAAPILLMDEPLANVDSARKAAYWEFIFNVVHEQNMTLIYSTHVPEEVIAYAERVICLDQGKLLADCSVNELYHSPPDKLTAELLGPGNWMTDGSFCRPEQLVISEQKESESVVEESRFFGSYCSTRIKENGEARTYFHRPAKALSKGMKVVLSILMLLLTACDPDENTLLEFSKSSSFNMPAKGMKLPGPRGICCGINDEVIVLDDAGRVLIYDENGKELRRWPMPETALGHPEGVTVFKDGKIAVADTHYARVVIFNNDGTVALIFGERGDKEGQFYSPVGITLDDKENIYVCEYGVSDRIQKFTKDGKFIKSFGVAGSKGGDFQRPSDLIWLDGKVYVADAVNNRIQAFSDEGEFIEVLKNKGKDIPLYLPYDLQLHTDGNLYIIEYGSAKITCITLEGDLVGVYGSPGTELNQFNTPWGIAVNSKGEIFVADTGNRRVVKLVK